MTICFFSLMLVVVQGLPEVNPDTLLNRGKALEARGKFEQALDTWGSAVESLESPDFRIGREYIRLATEQQLKEYYEQASAMYFWGLSAKEIGKGAKQALEREIEILSWIAGRDRVREWKGLLKQDNPEVLKGIRGYWNLVDPTPGTPYNERLIEHWERIAYARREFREASTTVIGTDDRGEYYVKFGRPERIHTGEFFITPMDIERTCAYLHVHVPRCNPDLMADAVLAWEQNPQYEVWIYDRFTNGIPIIFGRTDLSGFKRVKVVDDFIPGNAFTFSRSRYDFPTLDGRGGIDAGSMSPGMILQFIYYEKLAALNVYFARQFQVMEKTWIGTVPNAEANLLTPHQGSLLSQSAESEIQVLQKNLPEQESTTARLIPEILMETEFYRFLDEDNKPYYTGFVLSAPYAAFIQDLAHNDEVMLPGDSVSARDILRFYELEQGIQVLNEQGSVITQSSRPSPVYLSAEQDEPSVSVFRIPYMEDSTVVFVHSTLYNHHPETGPQVQTAFAPQVRGIGKRRIDQQLPAPLKLSPGRPVLADLVLGYDMNYDPPAGVLFPFYVSHTKEIPAGKALAFHVEVYNLSRSSLRMRYSVRKKRRMEWLLGSKKEVSLMLELQSRDGRYVNDIEVQTRELGPGDYILELEVLHERLERVAGTSLDFKIVK